MPDNKTTIEAEKLLSKNLNTNVKIIGSKPLGGGCINHAEWLETNSGEYFIKFNSSRLFPGMFEAEARGLAHLASTDAISVPGVIGVGSSGDNSFLLLEYLSQGSMANGFWEEFGRSLAKMHKHSTKQFGLDHDNYIGSLGQSNTYHDTWTEFFIEERLDPQLQRANLPGAMQDDFNKLYAKMDSVFPVEPPALVHGDLWSGNYMIGPSGRAVVIDPAVYYGHREMDLGMTRLFGGFDNAFYAAYKEAHPLEPGWEDRLDICNLYPLLVHVNLFGGGYINQVKTILNRFASV